MYKIYKNLYLNDEIKQNYDDNLLIIRYDNNNINNPYVKNAWEIQKMNGNKEYIFFDYNNIRETPTFGLWLIKYDNKPNIYDLPLAVCVIKQIDNLNYNLFNFAVNKNFHNKGYGSKLLKYAEKKIKDMGGKNIFLNVKNINNKGRKFYEKNNYFYVQNKNKYYVMKKIII